MTMSSCSSVTSDSRNPLQYLEPWCHWYRSVSSPGEAPPRGGAPDGDPRDDVTAGDPRSTWRRSAVWMRGNR